MKKLQVILLLSAGLYFGTSAQTDKRVLTFARSIEQEKKSDFTGAIETMKSLNDSVSYDITLRLAWLYYKAGLTAKSLTLYNNAIKINPQAIEPRYGYSFPAYLAGDYKDLIEQDNKILEIDPKNKIVNANLGLIYYYKKDYAKAIPYFEKVVSLYPFDYDNNLMLAWSYLKSSKDDLAEQCFNTVLLYSPKDVSAKDGLSAIKKTQNINEKMLSGFSKSYELSEKADYKGAAAALLEVYDKDSYAINLRLGWLNYLAGLQKESVNYYKIATAIKPEAIEAKLGCAIPAEVLGNKNDLKMHYESALSIDPHNTFVIYKLGVLAYQEKDYAAAQSRFEKLLNLYPCDTDGLLMLAWTNYQLGKTPESKSLFNKVLCMSPGNESALYGLSLKSLDQIKNTAILKAK